MSTVQALEPGSRYDLRVGISPDAPDEDQIKDEEGAFGYCHSYESSSRYDGPGLRVVPLAMRLRGTKRSAIAVTRFISPFTSTVCLPTAATVSSATASAVIHANGGTKPASKCILSWNSVRVKPGQDGVGAHPHAGIETVTYILSGRQQHRDSAGHTGIVSAGGAQWMTAGRGIIHAEHPVPQTEEEHTLHGIQLWTSLPRLQKQMEPRYQNLTADSITEVKEAGVHVRVIAGEYRGAKGPAQTFTPVNLFVAGFIGSPAMNLLSGRIAGMVGAIATIRLDIGPTVRVPLRSPVAEGAIDEQRGVGDERPQPLRKCFVA